jgi:hypothetical protein
MLSRLFPRQLDNTYQGHVFAIWLFVPVVLLKTLMGFNVAGLNPWVGSRFILQTADGVPVDTFPPQAATISVFLFASWGLALLVLALLAILSLVRYRAMLPLMFLALSIEQIGRKVLSMVHLPPAPAQEGISASALINWGLSAALVLGFILSLLNVRPRPPRG